MVKFLLFSFFLLLLSCNTPEFHIGTCVLDKLTNERATIMYIDSDYYYVRRCFIYTGCYDLIILKEKVEENQNLVRCSENEDDI